VTEDNRRKNIAIELARGAEALESAEILLSAAKHADAVSRAYYAAFHHACALLLIAGEQARRHAGVERLLQRDFVRAGKLSPEAARSFAHLMKDRHDADYGAEVVFTAELAKERVAAAREFCRQAQELLEREGWLEARGE
jgi:uncharacterized protein (UPF0332 family)